MGTLIDTSVLIEVERGRLSLEAFIDAQGDDEAAMAAVTAAELLHGVHRIAGSARAARAEAFVEGLIALLPVVPFDLAEARAHARLSADLHARGTAVGAHDLLIAATAVANDMRVATCDVRSFPRIQGLDLVQLAVRKR